MKHWPEQVPFISEGVECPHTLFSSVQAAALELGFEYCAFGFRFPYPLSRPRMEIFNNFPENWWAHYEQGNYLATDPTVAHGCRTMKPALWTRELFARAPNISFEARAVGLRYGWFQSYLETSGAGGLLTLARSQNRITDTELLSLGPRLEWLVQVVYQSFAALLSPRRHLMPSERLTHREIEVLKWTADGKTTAEIADILAISNNTVNFHIKRAVLKLNTSNKTAATVRAAMMGVLSWGF